MRCNLVKFGTVEEAPKQQWVIGGLGSMARCDSETAKGETCIILAWCTLRRSVKWLVASLEESLTAFFLPFCRF